MNTKFELFCKEGFDQDADTIAIAIGIHLSLFKFRRWELCLFSSEIDQIYSLNVFLKFLRISKVLDNYFWFAIDDDIIGMKS